MYIKCSDICLLTRRRVNGLSGFTLWILASVFQFIGQRCGFISGKTHFWDKTVADKSRVWTLFLSVFDAPSLGSPLVSDDGVAGGVDHRGVVDGGEITVHQVKFVHAQQSRPDGFDLDVGKVLPDAPVAAWGQQPKQMFSTKVLHRNTDGLTRVGDPPPPYQLQMVCRQTSPLRQDCRRGNGQAWTPTSAPRRHPGDGWRSGRRRLGGRRGWCTLLPSGRIRD